MSDSPEGYPPPEIPRWRFSDGSNIPDVQQDETEAAKQRRKWELESHNTAAQLAAEEPVKNDPDEVVTRVGLFKPKNNF